LQVDVGAIIVFTWQQLHEDVGQHEHMTCGEDGGEWGERGRERGREGGYKPVSRIHDDAYTPLSHMPEYSVQILFQFAQIRQCH
jgi:hypothetical protein